jgi:hypothetical protein
MTGADIGAALAAVIAVVLKLILDRQDKQRAVENEIQTIPDNLNGVSAARDRVRRIEAAQHLQSGGGSQIAARGRLD